MSLKGSVNFYNGGNIVPGSVAAVVIEDLKYEGFLTLDGKIEQYIAYQGGENFIF
ncbi:hypothetical protein [Ochrobactrum sp. RH2CCR150]|uniref:hypothetical protein n=1 Tax=Ochrobactrum sp. RH2CCR150 TaxID=2587044 RepID=UPI0015FE6641|nr:hypothetical protein [Ochrobactrum sp. RH2CCR150]